MCVIPATPSLYFLGVNCLQFPGSSGCGKQQTSCLCCVPLVHKAAISYQGKLESLNKQIWVVWGVQEPVSRGCWTVPNTQTATAVVGSQLWLRTLFKGCSLWVFDRRWVGGWLWSLTLFASCHQYLKQMDPPLLWADRRTNGGLCFPSSVESLLAASLPYWALDSRASVQGVRFTDFLFLWCFRKGGMKLLPSCYCCYRSCLLVMGGMYILHTIAGAERALGEGRHSN